MSAKPIAPVLPIASATGRDTQICALIGIGHFLSHFYMLCLPPLFLIWRDEFDVPFATLGLAIALMSGTTALLQTPVGFLVDRHGARPFLVGGTLLMALSIAGMAFAQGFWAILVLAVLSGIGNSVIHPADYAILAGSVSKGFMGRAFALHTFSGNLGFAVAPPAIAFMIEFAGWSWRDALLLFGLLGVPAVGAILARSRILADQPRARPGTGPALAGRDLLLSRPMLLFFAFFLLSSMAGAGVQAWLVTVLGQLWGTPALVATTALTGYMAGATAGTLVGGWIADRSQRDLLGMVFALTLGAMALLVSLGAAPLPQWLLLPVALVAGLALGTSRTPRDVMLRDASPPGQVGKVFGFVSAGLPLGSAITPVPMGLLIDLGAPWAVLPVVAALLGLSLLCAAGARGAVTTERRSVAQAAE